MCPVSFRTMNTMVRTPIKPMPPEDDELFAIEVLLRGLFVLEPFGHLLEHEVAE